MKKLLYFAIAACVSAGLTAYWAPSRDISFQWLLGVLGVLLLLFWGKDLYLHWLAYRAERASRRGNLDQVKSCYFKIYKLKPEGYIGKFAMGVIHSLNGHWVHAISNFREALKLRPLNPQAMFNFAICLLRLERYKEALTYLSLLAFLRPRWTFIFAAMGEAYYYLGKYKEACTCLQKELYFNPKNDGARRLLITAREAMEKAA